MALNYTTSPWQDAIESNMAGGLGAALRQASDTILARQQMMQNWALAQQEREDQRAWRQRQYELQQSQMGMDQSRLGLEKERLGLDKVYREAEVGNLQSLAKERRSKDLDYRMKQAQEQKRRNLAVTYGRAKSAGNEKLANAMQWQILAQNPAALEDYLTGQARTSQMQSAVQANALSRLRTAAINRGYDPAEIEQIVAEATGVGMPQEAAFPSEEAARAAGNGPGSIVTIQGVGKVRLH